MEVSAGPAGPQRCSSVGLILSGRGRCGGQIYATALPAHSHMQKNQTGCFLNA